jgi:mono/diheme cytochrome c family protein
MTKLVFAFSLFCVAASAQSVKRTPAGQTSAASGEEMYRSYCASCHGLDGRGNGPASSALATTPTDLTQLARRNGDRYPELRVFDIIGGDAKISAHGSKDMPVWGPLFTRLNEGDSPRAKLRIRNITKYIETIQAR